MCLHRGSQEELVRCKPLREEVGPSLDSMNKRLGGHWGLELWGGKMSLQVCGGSPGPAPTGAREAGRQGKTLQEEDRPVLSSTCPFRIEQQGSSLTQPPLRV